MKIIFNTGVFGKHGIENALVNLLLELPVNEHEYILHNIFQLDQKSPLLNAIEQIVTQDCSLPRSTFWGGLHMNRKKSIFHKLLDSLGLLKIHKLIANNINQHQADVVVDYDLSLLRSAHLISAPKIGFFHFRPKRFRNGGVNKLRRIGKRLKHYQLLVVLCDEMLQEACEIWPDLKSVFVVLPNSIHCDKLLNISKNSFSLPTSVELNKYFITIARLTHQKNIDLLLRSYKTAKDLGCSWPLVIAGEGEDKIKLVELCNELSITENIHFLGYQSNPHTYLANAGTFVMSSREEGFPVSLLEAMVLGCPIISLACPTGPTDILKNGKLGKLVTFTEDNPSELGLAMYELSRNSALRNEYALNDKYAKDYSSDAIAKNFMTLINNLVSGNQTSKL